MTIILKDSADSSTRPITFSFFNTSMWPDPEYWDRHVGSLESIEFIRIDKSKTIQIHESVGRMIQLDALEGK